MRVAKSPATFAAFLQLLPFVSSDDLKLGLTKLVEGKWEYVFGATTYPYPIFRSIELLKNGEVRMFFPDNFKRRSQDLPEAYHDAGQFCWAETGDAWIQQKTVFAAHSFIVRIRVGAFKTSIQKKIGSMLSY